jgi:signal transduction histidine kinase/CheY-like chemotaxis protein
LAYLSQSGQIIYCNSSFAEMLNPQARHDIAGRNLKTLVSATGWSLLRAALRDAASGPVEGELRIDSASGTRFLRLNLGPLDRPVFAGAEIHATAEDTTDVVNANAVVRERENSLRSLAARILKVQDQERRRIARDLHDVTGQEIAAISMALGSLLNQYQSSGKDFARDLTDSMSLLRKVQDEIRTLSYVLHPPLLDERGLGSALEWYVDGFRKRSGIDVDLRVPANTARLPVEKEIALFRVVQEGLTNVLRHSKSARAQISLSAHDTQVELSIRDEGVGINARQLARVQSEAGSEFGVGIPGMRERLAQLGGSLDLQAQKSGTRLVARVPLEAVESRPDFGETVQSLGRDRDSQLTGESPSHKRILVADDHEVVRQGIRTLLDHQTDWEICGEASNGFEAVSKARELRPDLILLDLTMPGLGGLSAAQQIRANGMETKILAFTTHSYPGIERVIRAAGCDGYVQKARAGEDLVTGIRTVLEGGAFFPPTAVQSVTA